MTRGTWRSAGLILVLVAGCVATPARQGGFPVLTPADTDPEAGYERPPTLAASALLAPELASGPHHHVREEVRTNGFLRLYSVDSDFGVFPAAGDFALRLVVQEIRAIGALRALSESSRCDEARDVAQQQAFVEAWELVTHPCESVHGVPPEAWGEVMDIAQTHPEQRSETENAARTLVLGFEATKRGVAHRLGVSPYSLNRTLQASMNEIAWIVSAGGLPMEAIPLLTADSVAPLPEDVIPSERLAEIYQFGSPEDLRRRNHIELAVMGLDEATTDAFLTHPAYSPRQQTGIVESLVALDPAEDRNAFIEAALLAEAPADALLFLMNALLLRAYHQNVAPVERMLRVGPRAAAGFDAAGKLIVPIQVDYLVWSRPTERFVERMTGPATEGSTAASVEVWISGDASPLARSEFERRGVTLVEGSFERAFGRLAPGPR